ncbi:hypothetical protein [Ahrensia kielensis]|uniref:hypothetical protein n=1 Tax=Ahrensia kielensis TaxID=76980 RepID=UPI000362F863|nr:hypothetical protein [Ahrensia kielensis]
MNRTTIALGLSVLVITSCAKRPDAISPSAIPESAYTNLSCSDLAKTRADEEANLKALSVQQTNAANGDAFGVFLIGVPMGSVTGGDKEGLISVSKGKIQAMEANRLSKGCGG